MNTPYIFISHSSKDKQIADAICHYLEEHGVACWIAPRDILPGTNYGASILNAIKKCVAMVLVYSTNSNSSNQVVKELERAASYSKVIIPFMIDSTPLNDDFEYHLSGTHWLTAYPEYRKMFQPLLNAVKQIYPSQLSTEPTAVPTEPTTESTSVPTRPSVSPSEPITTPVAKSIDPTKVNTVPQSTEPAKDNIVVESIKADWAPDITDKQKSAIEKILANMVFVEGGEMVLGATPEQGDMAQKDEKPAHKVKLSPYWMGKYTVTQEEWEAIMDSNPVKNRVAAQPIVKISFNDAQKFVDELKRLSGVSFALPSEAQWEYAARGGVKSKGYIYAGGNDPKEVGWMNESHLHSVGYKLPNELGIYDMSGNVEEWCDDEKGKYTEEFIVDPQYSYTPGFWAADSKVVRGGGYYDSKKKCRVSYRACYTPDNSFNSVGFRLIVKPSPKP